jgi:transcription initiation factor IIE alpha subunit
MNRKGKELDKIVKKLKFLDNEKFYFIGAKLKCPHCKKKFGIDKNYLGVITCPYCGKYIEG